MSELIATLRQQGMTNADIAERLGLHPNTVILRLNPDSRERQRQYNRNWRAKHKAIQYPPNVVRVGKAQSYVLSYFQGLAPVGVWFMPMTEHITADLDMSPSAISNIARKLEAKGLIARRKVGVKWYEYRVLRRLEDKDVHQVRLARNGAEMLQDMKREFVLAKRAHLKRKRKLIGYAGRERW